MTAAEAMRGLWEKFFAGKTTTGTVHVDGVTRPMTAEEMRLSDQAFGAMDEVWAKHNKVFDEARRENRRRKVWYAGPPSSEAASTSPLIRAHKGIAMPSRKRPT